MKKLPLTKQIAEKVLCTVDAGLVKGLGNQKPGEMCVEAAVCYAYGLPHSDSPPCVGDAVRAFKINLNDSNWSSDKARTEGMRKLAIAQLGSDTIDQRKFSEIVTIKIINTIIADTFNVLAKLVPYHTDVLNSTSNDLRTCTLSTARAAAGAAKAAEAVRAAWAAWAAVEAVRAAAWAAAGAAAMAAARAAAGAAARAAAGAAAWAAEAVRAAWAAGIAVKAARAAAEAAEAAGAAVEAVRAAAGAAKAAGAARDKILNQAADIALQALIELKSPGCKYLYLCDKE